MATPHMTRWALTLTCSLLLTSCMGEDPAVIRAQFSILQKKANLLEANGRLEEAITKLEEAIVLVRDRQDYATVVASLKAHIKMLRNDISTLEKVETEFRECETTFNEGNPTRVELNDLFRKVRNIQKSIRLVDVPYKKDVDVLLGRIDARLSMPSPPSRYENADFQVFLNKSIAIYKLSERGEECWGPAIKAWKEEFLSRPKLTPRNREKAESRITSLSHRAIESVIYLRKRATRQVEEDGKETALDYLENQQPRFSGSGDAETMLEEAIERFEEQE